MTDKPKKQPANAEPAVEQAKGAAREVIGKLIGDDAEVSAGQRQKAEGRPDAKAAAPRKNQPRE